ncbi:MAG: hypothetical protein ACI9A1_000567 [Lentimonas sp.]
MVGVKEAKSGLIHIWSDHGAKRIDSALRAHRALIFGQHASDAGLPCMMRKRALKVLVLEQGDVDLPKAVLLRCRVRDFTAGAIWA